MKNLYIRLPDREINNYNFNVEFFTEAWKSELRSTINSVLGSNLFVLNNLYLKIFIVKFVSQFELLKIDEENEKSNIIFTEEHFIKLCSFPELEEIFRQEIEYWIIRRKLPVIVCYPDGYFASAYISIYLQPVRQHKDAAHYKLFANFREAESFILKTVPVDRVSVTGSEFETENNLLVLYKIK